MKESFGAYDVEIFLTFDKDSRPFSRLSSPTSNLASECSSPYITSEGTHQEFKGTQTAPIPRIPR